MNSTETPMLVETSSVQPDASLVGEIKSLLASDQLNLARQLFEKLVEQHQKRATRIAYSYLRDLADVDEAVQDAFVKAFLHLPSFKEELLFENWFTRILVNGCLDRVKARTRRTRWLLPFTIGRDLSETHGGLPNHGKSSELSPEARVLMKERRTRLARAINRLPDRQRSVILLTQLEGHTPRDVAQMLSISEATVRGHLFRAIRSLRRLLGSEHWMKKWREPAGKLTWR